MTPNHYLVLSLITLVVLLGIRQLMIQREKNKEALKEYDNACE